MNSESLLFLQALQGNTVSRPPVWMMRQAGRYLPEYQELKKKYDFFTRVESPELACEITLQPIRRFGMDAAILFSDILVVPKAMGMEVQMLEGKGPILPKTIKTEKDIRGLRGIDAVEHLNFVFDALKLVRHELNGTSALIGFAGAPFTLLCYMIEGKGSKAFDLAKQFCFTQPNLAHQLLQKITDITIQYALLQVRNGAQAIQIFDSWSGLLSPHDFKTFAEPYLIQISDAVSAAAPVILYPKGSWYALDHLSRSSASALGVDWTLAPSVARTLTHHQITLQGNFDPNKLMLSPKQIHQEVKQMIDQFGAQKYIANLGHGILPNIPIAGAEAFVSAVKEYSI